MQKPVFSELPHSGSKKNYVTSTFSELKLNKCMKTLGAVLLTVIVNIEFDIMLELVLINT